MVEKLYILDKKITQSGYGSNKQESLSQKFLDYDSNVSRTEELYPNDKVEEFDGIKAPDHGNFIRFMECTQQM